MPITRECEYKTNLILSIEQNSIIQKQTEELNKTTLFFLIYYFKYFKYFNYFNYFNLQ
jgi:hypothetical protein